MEKVGAAVLQRKYVPWFIETIFLDKLESLHLILGSRYSAVGRSINAGEFISEMLEYLSEEFRSVPSQSPDRLISLIACLRQSGITPKDSLNQPKVSH